MLVAAVTYALRGGEGERFNPVSTAIIAFPHRSSDVIDVIYGGILEQVADWPAVLVFLGGLGVLILSFKLLDVVVPKLDDETLGERRGAWLRRKWQMFALGLMVAERRKVRRTPEIIVMRKLLLATVALVALTGSVHPLGAATYSCREPRQHAPEKHEQDHGLKLCGMIEVGGFQVSETGGLGQIELHGDVAAVLQRDEGIVSLVDIKDPSHLKVLGRYDDGAQQSLDGDVVFSDDGQWLFYARQTVQFSRDGIHVLDVSDPKQPRFASYMPGGGSFRIGYFRQGDAEYVVVLDAIDGLVVNRFVRESGTLVRVFQDAEPALKVGGPSSAGVFIDRKDPATGSPLMYVTTGRTGLQIYDISTPEAPTIVGSWDEVGLSDVEVRATKKGRTVWAATEYWFDAGLEPEVVVLDATKLDAIRRRRRLSMGLPADDFWRVQGIDRHRGGLFVAHSHAGVVSFRKDDSLKRAAAISLGHNPEAGAMGSLYSMDVEVRRPYIFVTDASTGGLIVYRRCRPVSDGRCSSSG